MFGNKEFTGISLESDLLRLARIEVVNNKFKIKKLDQFSLVEEVFSTAHTEDVQQQEEEVDQSESVFGFDELDDEEEEEDISFSDLEGGEEEFVSDMVRETQEAQSNDILLYTVLSDINKETLHLGLNVPAGNTIYQIISNTDFRQVEEDDLKEDLENKLESIYGVPQSPDNYSYEIRDDGSLLLGSVDEESPTLSMVNAAREYYTGKLKVEEILADEMVLVGLVRMNYELYADEISCIIQCGRKVSRVIFMQGKEVWLVAPLINEGTDSRSFLNTVFSKILFQLDTGEVPNLDRILLANNTLGNSAIKFFKDNFPDVIVENLTLDEKLFDFSAVNEDSVRSFTTAIGVALGASGSATENFPKLSFLPSYVKERQKIFKLQWHGMVLLFLIFLSPITFNYLYNQNVQKIETAERELTQINSQITQINPIVESTNEIKDNLAILREKLVLLDTLSQNSMEWSVKFDILNDGINEVNNSWITSMSESDDGVFIQGYALNRNRIPRIVNIFNDATLLNVTSEEIREQEVYNFSILAKSFVADPSVYSPDSPDEVQALIEN